MKFEQREIKFRGLCGTDWYYGYYYIDGIGDSIIYSNGIAYVVEPETVTQYTGLKDKYGKEILEGDIIRDNFGKIGVVEYDNDRSAFVCRGLSRPLSDRPYKLMVAIGNIFQNPELLEDKDEQ